MDVEDSDAEQADRVERLPQALTEDGATVDLGDGRQVPVTGAVALLVADMVNNYDQLQWEKAGGQGTPPRLTDLLSQVRTEGRKVEASEWVNLLDQLADPALAQWRDRLLGQVLAEDGTVSRAQVLPTDVQPYLKVGPRDVVRLRNELVGWLEGTNGPDYYQTAIMDGRQHVYMQTPGVHPAVALAQAEAAALKAADLYFIDEHMCGLLAAAHPSMPTFAPMRHDLPSERGFAVFALPVSSHHNDKSQLAALLDPHGATAVLDQLYSQASQVIACTWRPHPGLTAQQPWPCGGVWFTFYAAPMARVFKAVGGPLANSLREHADWLATLCPENEAISPWYDHLAGSADEEIARAQTLQGTGAWMRVVLAAFRLACQPNLAEVDTVKVAQRPVSNAKARKGVKPAPGGQIRVVRLRGNVRSEAEQGEGCGEQAKREYRHRWVVRGFWRNTWYPSTGVHRPQWIAPHLKGPADAPLKGGEKVHLVSPQRGGHEKDAPGR